MGWIDAELVLIALSAMLSPTTLSFSILALVLSKKPLRTGIWFYLGALSVTLVIGVAAAFVLGNAAADPSSPSSPKTWVAIVDVVAAVLLLLWALRRWRKPVDPAKMDSAIEKMSKVSTSPAIAIVAAGATLANPGAFIPLALKTISETNPSAEGYVVQWLFFALVSLLPLLVAIVLLAVAPGWAGPLLARVRDWLVANAMKVALVLVIVLAAVLLKNGITGLVS